MSDVNTIVNVSVKPWWQSKTLWLNVVAGLIALLAAIAPSVPQNLMPVIALITAVANVVLRFLTNQPIQ